MKVLCLFNSFLSYKNHISGGDEFFSYNLKFLLKNKKNTFLILTSSKGKDFLLKKVKFSKRVKFLVTPDIFEKFHFFISYVLRTFFSLIKIRYHKFDIIFSSSDFFPDVLPAYFHTKKNFNQKWYQCVFHFYPPWLKREGSVLRSFFGFYLQKLSLNLIKKSNKVIVINNIVKNKLINEYHFKSKKIEIIYPSIDLKIEKRKNPKRPIAIFLGRLVPSKGVFDIPFIWKIVTKNIPDAKIYIIGKGENKIKNKIKKIIKKEGLQKKVILKGFLNDQQLKNYFKKSKLFILPSREEGFGIVILQAMQFGLDIVVWNLPILKDLFSDSLHFINRFKYNKYADKVIKLLKKPSLKKRKYKKILLKYSQQNQEKKLAKLFK